MEDQEWDSDCFIEPMDVDRSNSTISKMDISNIDDSGEHLRPSASSRPPPPRPSASSRPSPPRPSASSELDINFSSNPKNESMLQKSIDTHQRKSRIKTYHIRKSKVPQDKKHSPIKFVMICTAIFFCILAAIYKISSLNCSDPIDIIKVRKTFTENLFGQTTAANKIIEILNLDVSSKIILLYGGTGVGKTYAVSLMLENLWKSANVYLYTMPTFADTFSPELMFGLIACQSSVVVIDDLKLNDNIKTQLLSILSKSEKLDKNILIVLIYNCENVNEGFSKSCDSNFGNELEKQFADVRAEKCVVPFQPLTTEDLKKCIEKELKRKVDKKQMNTILQNFNVTFDGCKGVYKKINFFNVS